MPEPETAAPAASDASAPPSSQSDAPADDGYDPKWMGSLDSRRKADIEEFFKQHPVYQERDALKSTVARREKWGNLTREQVEGLSDPIGTLERYKAILVAKGVATQEDIEDAQTPRELELVLRGVKAPAAPAPASKTGSKDGDENPFFSQLDAWAKSRGVTLPPASGTKPRDPPSANEVLGNRGAGVQGAQSHKEMFRGDKPLPSAAEIDRAVAAEFQNR